MTETVKLIKKEEDMESLPIKNNKIKGVLWGILYALTAAIFITIPTKLIVNYWVWLNDLTFNGEPIYTLALFMLFLYLLAILISAIYVAATLRAFIQRKNPDLGISRGVRGFAIVSTSIVVGFMIIWFILTGGQIAFFSIGPL